LTKAEVTGAAQVNLQPAEHLLFCKQFSKMCPSAFSVFGPPGPGGGRGDQACTKTFFPSGDVHAKFHQERFGAGVWISISPSHTNRQRNIQVYKNGHTDVCLLVGAGLMH